MKSLFPACLVNSPEKNCWDRTYDKSVTMQLCEPLALPDDPGIVQQVCLGYLTYKSKYYINNLYFLVLRLEQYHTHSI